MSRALMGRTKRRPRGRFGERNLHVLPFGPSGPPADTITPEISSTSPADDATDAAVDAAITLTFNVAVALATGNIVLRDVSGAPVVVETFNVATGIGDGGGTVTVANRTVTITPGANLNNTDDYAIQVDATAIDNAVNAALSFAGIADDTTLNFSTVASTVGQPIGLLLTLTKAA